MILRSSFSNRLFADSWSLRWSKLNPVNLAISFFILLIIIISWISFNPSSRSQSWHVYDQINRLYETSPRASNSQLAPNQKFLVRDWSIYLGWNNMRYVIEAGLLLAKILDRQLVLPAFVYANSCEYDDQVCAALTPMFAPNQYTDISGIKNRTWYPDPEHGTNHLLPQYRKVWVIPIDTMLDVDHVVSTWGYAIRLEEFHKLTNPDPSYHSIGMSDGKWNTDYNRDMTYKFIPKAMLTNFSTTYVDRLPKPITPLIDPRKPPSSKLSPLASQCESTLARFGLSVKRTQRRALPELSQEDQKQANRLPDWNGVSLNGDQLAANLSEADDQLLERCLASNGSRTAYGYGFEAWWMKAPYEPRRFVKKYENMMGLWDELSKFNQTILHLEGELHNGFPPGLMVWTSVAGREQFEKLTRTAVRPPQWYHDVAAKLELRMRARCGGRSWVGTHIRRGDFLSFEWAALDFKNQWKWIESGTTNGAALLRSNPALLKPCHRQFKTSLQPPNPGDPIYVATNVRGADELAYLRTKKIVMLSDLLEESDKAELGFSGKFMDTLSVLEQCLLMRSGYYYGDAHSSFDGWILNRRVFYGIDEQVTKIEYLKQPGDGQ